MEKKIFKPGCKNEVDHACKFSSTETLLRGKHIREHVNLPNRADNLESIFTQTCEGTKEVILEFLTKENSKYSELRRKIIDSFSQSLSNSEKDLGGFTSKLDCYSDEINNFIAKISQATKLLKSEPDPILGLLSLQPQEAIEKIKLMTIANRDWYNGAKLFYIFNQKLKNLKRAFFTEICGAYLEKRNIKSTPKMHNKISKPTSIKSANVKNSISMVINKSCESLKGSKSVSKPIKANPKSKTIFLNSQKKTASNDLNSKPKKSEKAFNVIDTLRNKIAKLLSSPNNPELEIDFRTTCSTIQIDSRFYNPPLKQAYQNHLNAYQQKTSLYNITKDRENNRTNLIIYNTETNTQEVKILQTPQPLDCKTCITQLPNGKLFCFGKSDPVSGIAVLIDVNGKVKVLPSGPPCYSSSCIYFNNSVYCFGGKDGSKYSTLSCRFDLCQNRWIELVPMPKADYWCNSIIFNRDILISGYENRGIRLYSIDLNSFSIIPYCFEAKKIKILINAERLYLIECPGWICESEIGSYSKWRRIGESKIYYDPFQLYCSYNKGGICISTIYDSGSEEYYCFNLDQKIVIDVAYYDRCFSFRRVGQKIEKIKCNTKNFKLNSHDLDEWNLKGNTLKDLVQNLEKIEHCNKFIKHFPSADSYITIGKTFLLLGRHLEALKYYDEAIKLDSSNANSYSDKGYVFHSLGRYLEAIECYDKAIKRNPYYNICYDQKGNACFILGRYLEAIEWYDQAIKRCEMDPNFYWKKGHALNELGRYPEALESYSIAIEICPKNARYYNDKGNTLYILESYQEAMQCYDEAIKLEPNNPLYFCSRGRLFNGFRQEEAALQDFNRAYNLKQKNEESGVSTKNEWNLSWKDINFINDVLGQDRIELLQKI